MTLNAGDARDEYTASSGQTVFNYTFKIYASTDLNVYQTPSGQECSDSDLITTYTVSGVGAATGGTITLNSGATSGDLITIVSAIPTDRTVDYQNNGDFRPDTVNDDFDKSYSLIKQIEDVANRSLQFPQCLQGATSLSLPAPVAGNLVRWKNDVSGLENVAYPANILNVVSEDVAVVDGQLSYSVTTGGLSIAGGRIELAKGGSEVDGTLLVAGTDYTVTGDQSFNLLRSYPGGVLRISNTVTGLPTSKLFRSVLEYGAVGDGVTDDATAIRAALASGNNIVFPFGYTFYVASGEVSTDLSPHNSDGMSYFNINTEGQHIRIDGTIRYKNDNAESNNPNCFYISADNVTISGGTFEHDVLPTVKNIHSGNAVAPYGVRNFTLENGVFNYCRQGCILYNTIDSQILNCFHHANVATETGSSAAFKIRGGSGNLIDNCTSYHGLSDGNMGIFGTGSGNKITNCNLYNRDIDGNAGIQTRQGISIDSGQQYASVTNNVVEDFYYNIDVKTNINGCQVVGNVIKTKKIAIAVRWGEGTQNTNGCTIANNSIVFSEGITDPTPASFFTANNPSDDQVNYTTFGILVDHMEGAVSITGNNFGPDLDDGAGTVRACCICVKGNTNVNNAREDKCGVTVSGNVFRLIHEIGTSIYRVYGPLVGIAGDLNSYGTELPTVNFVGNTVKLPNKTDTTTFSCIDGGSAESVLIDGNTWVYDTTFGSLIYLKDSRALTVTDNIFGATSSTIVQGDTVETVLYTGNTSYDANLDSTDVLLTDCTTVICNSNIFNRNTTAGLAINSSGTTTNFIAIGNYVEGIAGAISHTATNSQVANNIIVS